MLLLLVNPCDAGFLHLLLDSSSPGVLWSASIPLSLTVPLESSSCAMLSLGFLNVCPIHVHLLLLSRTSVDSWSVAFHYSTLLILSYHLIPRILLRDLFINTWILLVSAFVDLQVTEPYNNNCFTFELSSLNFVLLLYTIDVHTLSIILKATFALPSLSLTSSSVPPVGFGVRLITNNYYRLSRQTGTRV